MAENKVQLQMWKANACKSSMRYTAMGKAALEVCGMIYVQDQAIEKIGRPDVIKVTIEAASLTGKNST